MLDSPAPGADRRAPVVLAFDTAGAACSVAIGRDGLVLAHELRRMQHGHAEALLPMVDRVMNSKGLAPFDIDIIAVTVGPGGFTGIRAGLAAAHGLALASGARLVGLTSFDAVAAPLRITADRLLVALDSRRMDFYVQLFDPAGEPLCEPAVVPTAELSAWLGEGDILVAGDAAKTAGDILAGYRRVQVLPNTAPEANGVLAALHRWPERADPLAQPLYLRPPEVSFPKTGIAAGDAT